MACCCRAPTRGAWLCSLRGQHQLKGCSAEDFYTVQEQVWVMTDKHHVYLTQVMIALLCTRLSVLLLSSFRPHAICESKCASIEFHASWVAVTLLVCRLSAYYCV